MNEPFSGAVSFGVIGTNFISDSFCDAARRAGFPVTAVYSRARETGCAFAEKHGIPHVFCDFSAFSASDVFQAAYIASPNSCHAAQSERLLRAGKHVLCEKPASPDEASFCFLCRLAKASGVVFLEAMRPAHDPAADVIKACLPRCGTLRYAHFEYSQYSSRYDRFKNGELPNAFNPQLCNAAVMDIGIYPIHLCVMLFGRPERILSRSVKLENGFEAQGNALLFYGGMTVDIAYSKVTQAALPSFIRGEDGEIRFGSALSKISELSFARRGGEVERLPFVPAENNMIYELQAFSDFVAGTRDPMPYLASTASALSVVDEIRRQNGIRFPSDK